MNSKYFKNGDKVRYNHGVLYTFVGLDPEDSNFAYCKHPKRIDNYVPGGNIKIVERLPARSLTKYVELESPFDDDTEADTDDTGIPDF